MTTLQKTKCQDCSSRAQGLLCDLSSQELDHLNEVKFHSRYKALQHLFYTGNSATGIFCVLSGAVKLESLDENGKTQIVQIYGAGSLIGYRALFTDEPYLSSAVAVDDVEVCFIPKTAVLELVKTNPNLALKFLSQLSQDFRMMELRLRHAASHTASERIAEALLFLRDNFEKNWTRKEIADWAGTTPETVMRTLAEFETQGLIEQKGRKINILKRSQLLALSKISV